MHSFYHSLNAFELKIRFSDVNVQETRGDRIQMQIVHGSAGLQWVGHSAFLSSSWATCVVDDLGTLTTRVPEDLTMN